VDDPPREPSDESSGRRDETALLAKCDELLELLYEHREHAKLRALVADIEALRDRLRRRT
jgi:hypothetical protein